MFIKPNIQLFAEGNTDFANGGNGPEPKTYIQEELDRIVNERTGIARKYDFTFRNFEKGCGYFLFIV